MDRTSLTKTETPSTYHQLRFKNHGYRITCLFINAYLDTWRCTGTLYRPTWNCWQAT